MENTTATLETTPPRKHDPENQAPTSRKDISRLHLLTVMRFPAALWVVVFHLQHRFALPVPPPLRTFLHNGALAMTFFFVLSGTMLTYGYRNLQLRGPELLAFYRSRFARVYPAYAVVHLVVLFWFTPASVESVTKWVYTNLLSVAGVQAWFPHSSISGANNGTWSISAEIFFYALFPVLLLAARFGWERGYASKMFLFAWIATTVTGIAGSIFEGGLLYYMLPSHRLPEFVVGILIGLKLIQPIAGIFPAWRLLLAASLAGAAAINTLVYYTDWTAGNAFVVPVFAGLIYSLARFEQSRVIDFSGRVWRTLIYLGESSYCLFLVHLIPLVFFDSPFGKAWAKAAIRINSLEWLWMVVIAGSLIGAILLHELVEKPARRALFRRWKP